MTAPLAVEYLGPMDRVETDDGLTPFALFRFGRGTSHDAPATIDVPLRTIGEPRSVLWSTDSEPERFERNGFRGALTDELLVAWCSVDAARIEDAARVVYRRMLELLEGSHPYLMRVWNVVPDIHGDEAQSDGATLERYRAFSRGRAESFERALGEHFEHALPAASTVGSHGGELFVGFLAGRCEVSHLENPRQVAAWRYPSRYGPRPPSFARATRTRHSGSELLLSGTASVVGHASRHSGDVAAQTRETIANLDALCGHAGAEPFEPKLLRVFVRDSDDAPTVEAVLRERYGFRIPLLLLEADICRRDLLVEVEGIGGRYERAAATDAPSAVAVERQPTSLG